MKNKIRGSQLVNCLNLRRIGPDPFFQESCTASGGGWSHSASHLESQVTSGKAQSCGVFFARLVDTAVDDHICECGQEMMEFKNWRVPAATLAELAVGWSMLCICPCKDWKVSECLICLSSGDVSGKNRK